MANLKGFKLPDNMWLYLSIVALVLLWRAQSKVFDGVSWVFDWSGDEEKKKDLRQYWKIKLGDALFNEYLDDALKIKAEFGWINTDERAIIYILETYNSPDQFDNLKGVFEIVNWSSKDLQELLYRDLNSEEIKRIDYLFRS